MKTIKTYILTKAAECRLFDCIKRDPAAFADYRKPGMDADDLHSCVCEIVEEQAGLVLEEESCVRIGNTEVYPHEFTVEFRFAIP